MPQPRSIKVAFPSLRIPPDPTDVGSAGDYQLLLNLTRPLLRFREDEQVYGDALAAWTAEKGFKSFTFTLKPNLRFSNGEPITAEDVCRGIQLRAKTGNTIHFDFSLIDKVIAKGPLSFSIELKKPYRNLLAVLAAPEFAIYHKDDLVSPDTKPSFKVTSGAYFVEGATPNKTGLLLRQNPFYEEFSDRAPASVEVSSFSKLSELLDPKTPRVPDLFAGVRISEAEHNTLTTKMERNTRLLNLGFTYFLSLNSSRPSLTTATNRRALAKILRFSATDCAAHANVISHAKQLYLPEGPGRLSDAELITIDQTIETTASKRVDFHEPLKILMQESFPFRNAIERKLNDAGIKFTITTFKTWTEFASIPVRERYDVVQVNNDFSAIDLLENLKVTLNPLRPLAFVPADSEINKMVSKAEAADEPSEKYGLFKSVAQALLTDAYVVPVFHDFMKIYYAKSLHLDGWEKTGTEVPFWKIQVLKN